MENIENLFVKMANDTNLKKYIDYGIHQEVDISKPYIFVLEICLLCTGIHISTKA